MHIYKNRNTLHFHRIEYSTLLKQISFRFYFVRACLLYKFRLEDVTRGMPHFSYDSPPVESKLLQKRRLNTDIPPKRDNTLSKTGLCMKLAFREKKRSIICFEIVCKNIFFVLHF